MSMSHRKKSMWGGIDGFSGLWENNLSHLDSPFIRQFREHAQVIMLKCNILLNCQNFSVSSPLPISSSATGPTPNRLQLSEHASTRSSVLLWLKLVPLACLSSWHLLGTLLNYHLSPQSLPLGHPQPPLITVLILLYCTYFLHQTVTILRAGTME